MGVTSCDFGGGVNSPPKQAPTNTGSHPQCTAYPAGDRPPGTGCAGTGGFRVWGQANQPRRRVGAVGCFLPCCAEMALGFHLGPIDIGRSHARGVVGRWSIPLATTCGPSRAGCLDLLLQQRRRLCLLELVGRLQAALHGGSHAPRAALNTRRIGASKKNKQFLK